MHPYIITLHYITLHYITVIPAWPSVVVGPVSMNRFLSSRRRVPI